MKRKLETFGKFEEIKRKLLLREWNPVDFLTIFLSTLIIGALYPLFIEPTGPLRFLGFDRPENVTETWNQYKHLFQKHETKVMTADFLAALVQAKSKRKSIGLKSGSVEGSIWEFYREARLQTPGSFSPGLYQITDDFYGRAQNYCVEKGRIRRRKPWYAFSTCWNRLFYSRLYPSHAIEMTSAYLTLTTRKLLKRFGKKKVRRPVQQTVAAIRHFCGKRIAYQYVKRDFKAIRGQKCDSQSLSRYIQRVKAYQKAFQRAAQKT